MPKDHTAVTMKVRLERTPKIKATASTDSTIAVNMANPPGFTPTASCQS
jgi:hypothetical protein